MGAELATECLSVWNSQALVYDILPPTTAIIKYAIRLLKLSEFIKETPNII